MSWLDQHKVTRRVIVLIGIALTIRVTEWAIWFSTGNARNGMEMAAIIAAVTSPVMAFTAVVFRAYIEGDKV